MSGRKKSGTRRDGLGSKIASVNKLESTTPSNSNNTTRPLSNEKGHKAGAATTKIGRINEKSIQNSNRKLKEISKALKQAEKVTLPKFRGNKTLQAVKSHVASKPESSSSSSSRPEAQDKKVMGGRMKVKYQESQGFSPTLTKSINLEGSTGSESSVVKCLKKPMGSSASSPRSAAMSQKRSLVVHGSRSDTMPARISLSLM